MLEQENNRTEDMCEGNTDNKATTQKILKVRADEGQYPTSAVGILSLYSGSKNCFYFS